MRLTPEEKATAGHTKGDIASEIAPLEISDESMSKNNRVLGTMEGLEEEQEQEQVRQNAEALLLQAAPPRSSHLTKTRTLDARIETIEALTADQLRHNAMGLLESRHTFSSVYAPLRSAVAHLMLNDDLSIYRCTAEQLLQPLKSLVADNGEGKGSSQDGDGEVEIVKQGDISDVLDVKLIRKAFGGRGEFSVPYTDMGISGVGGGVLYVRVGKEVESAVVSDGDDDDETAKSAVFTLMTDFRYFPSESEVKLSVTAPLLHPLDNWTNHRNKLINSVPEEVKEELKDFLTMRLVPED
eukprot:CAMPEP_0172577566 /NCGR_PEP_ID=MMETSP1067-20121228/138297_1 /TAXON_ID=265564 ORGANISM="Thalassiosira punctigera, Strain Tpunct2005C2" /NCGR_SAMPLE_ID=MMETSP1067 /ASSEMBLY_ACC=CAM_ASM_000444 /LENGTH=296 /DNA_ID=CAMNT_0013370255 /DNA_START=14 /DNA_END=904 /DNA_ORIENTATION=-